MPQISSIERQKKRDNRVNVFVDGNFFVGLTDNELLRFDLYKGKNLEQEELDQIKDKSVYGKIKDKAMRLISIRPRSTKELKDKLILKKYNLSLIDKVLHDLKKEKFLDDKTFTKQWIYHRTEFSGHGKRRIESELFKKGVISEIIEKEIPKIKESQELLRALGIAQKKQPLIRETDKYKKREKLAAFLSRKGYSWEIIKKVLDSFKS